MTSSNAKDEEMMKRAADEIGDGEEHGSATSVGATCFLRSSETLLRLVPIGLCVAALIAMLNNSQSNDYGSISYSNIGSFKYLVYANGICAGYSLLSAFFTAFPRPPSMSRAWSFFFFDQVFTYVILAAATASTEIVYMAYNGDDEVTWSKECGVFGRFCHRAMVSVATTFAAVVCYMLLSLISSYRLFSSYEAPLPFLTQKAGEIAAFPR